MIFILIESNNFFFSHFTSVKFTFSAENDAPIENNSEGADATEKVEPLSIEGAPGEGDEKKKKKKKNKSKSGKGPSKEQTVPPTIPIAELYPNGMLLLFITFVNSLTVQVSQSLS